MRTVRTPLAVAAALALTVLVLVPGRIYFGNITEFDQLFVELLPTLLACATLATVVIAALLMCLPAASMRPVAVSVVFAVALAAWIQSTLLVWNYGTLAGQRIAWETHRVQGLIDVAVWAAVFATAIAGVRIVHRIAFVGSLILVAVQLAGLSADAALGRDRWINYYSFDDSARFAFSADRNVIILVLDTFQSDIFQELLDGDASLAADFQGFTYFRNAVGGFPSTAASIPLILTGRFYDDAIPFDTFVKSAYTTASLPQALKAAHYHVYYYNNRYYWPSLYADESIASHVRPKTLDPIGPITRQKACELMSLALFRSAPQPGKRLLEPYEIAIVTPFAADDGAHPDVLQQSPTGEAATPAPQLPGDAPFFVGLRSGATVTMPVPTFKYYHLWGLHRPLTHDDQLAPQSLPYTRGNAKRQARGMLRLLHDFFGTLRERGIYDRSMVLVVGDHGSVFEPRLPAVLPEAGITSGAGDGVTENPFGLPLVLVKPIGATGALQISDRPVSLADIPRTVADGIGLSARFPGESMFDSAIQSRRPRRVLKYDPSLLRLTARYFPPMIEYEVSGFSWLGESWRRTGREYSPGSMHEAVTGTRQYSLGQPLKFGINGNINPYLAAGWGEAEPHLHWTLGHHSRLSFQVGSPKRDLVLRARVVPARFGTITRQRADVFANGHQVAQWSVGEPGDYTASIPRAFVPGEWLDVSFSLPDAVIPHEVAPDSADQRMLALAMLSAVIEESGDRSDISTPPAATPP